MISNISPVQPLSKNQWISFVEGSGTTAPVEADYPLQVLGADHNLNNIDGGDPTDGFTPWVSDMLVYPTSDYWETLLNGNRVRPYIDLSISEYNTLRLPSAVHDYDLYADTGKFYEDVTIDGTLTVSSISIDSVQGKANTTAPLLEVTSDVTFNNDHTGYIYHCKPASTNLTITLPTTSSEGVIFTVNNALAGKTVTFANLTNARGTVLSQQFSAATIYWDGSAWYGIGDLV